MLKIHHPLRILALAIFLAVIACQPKSQPSFALSATLKELTGTVNIKPAGSGNFTKAAANMTLEVNGSVQTGADGRVRLDLSTGTIIRMSPSSVFTLVAQNQSGTSLATNLKLDLGRIFIILKGGSMDVDTPSGVASVRGSYLSVEVDPINGDVYVTCLEGDCSAKNPAGGVNLTDGEKTILFHKNPDTGNYTPPGMDSMSPEDFQKWLDENPEAKDLLNQAYATMTAMASTQPPATEPPATQPPATEPPPPAGPKGCSIIGPLGGSDLPKYGPVTFAWNPQAGAARYIVTFHYPNGVVGTFITTDTNLNRDMDTMKGGGDYSWDVQGVDEAGNALCKSEAISFSKPQYGPDNSPRDDKCDPCDPYGACFDIYAQCGG